MLNLPLKPKRDEYILQSIGMVFGITFIAAIIVNYLKRDEVEGTLVDSHFRWQMRTFWFGLLWFVAGSIATVIGMQAILNAFFIFDTVLIFMVVVCMIAPFIIMGVVLFVANVIWVLYRIIRGWFALYCEKPMYANE